MAINTLATLDALETLVDGLAAVQTTYVGIPNSLDARLSGIVAVAAPALKQKAAGLVMYTPRFYLGLGYRLVNSTAVEIKAAERGLATALDQLINALLADRTIDGTVDDIELDFSFANNALYQMFAAQENRLFSISIQTTTQHLVSS